MCFSILRITYGDKKKESIECNEAEDERIKLNNLRARPQVVKVMVMRPARIIEKTETWSDSAPHLEISPPPSTPIKAPEAA